MARPKKKQTNPAQSMQQLQERAMALFKEPYDDRQWRGRNLPSLRAVAFELGTTILRTRKLLITAGYYSSETSRLVQALSAEGRTDAEIMETTGLKRASVNSFLPYKKLAFNLEQTTVNADRHRIFRQRVKAVKELQTHIGLPDEAEYLWRAVIAFEGYPFKTSGRGNRSGVIFRYIVSEPGSAGGRHYKGENVEGYGNEIFIINSAGERREKSISRSSVYYAFRIARTGDVTGPKQLKIYGSNYVYAIFVRFGVITNRTEVPR